MEKTLKFVCAAVLLSCMVGFGSSVEYGGRCDPTSPPSGNCTSRKPYICDATSLTCVCSNPGEMYHDIARDTCVVFAGSSGCRELVSNVIPIHCTANAYCENEINIDGTCHCNAGSIDDGHYCKLGFMGSCTTSRDCATSAFLQCGPDAKCQCEEKYTWDVATNRCLGLVGGACNMNSTDPPLRQCSSSSMECTDNICVCPSETHKPTPDGRCLVKLNGTCTTLSDCHPDYPVCDGADGSKTCQCAEGHEERSGQCYILVDQPCNLPNNSATCNTYSDCNNGTEPPTCTCNDNYAPDGNHCKGLLDAFCVRTGPVNSTTDDCHTPSFLECVDPVPRKCDCKSGYKDAGNGGCLADYGTSCTNSTECHPDFPLCQEDAAAPTPATVFICGCESEKQYDEGQCRIMAGKECGQEGDVCLTYAHCNNASTPVCECDPNYTQVEDLCIGNLGAECRTIDDCNDALHQTCNNASICACADNYQEQGGICKGELEAPCSGNSDCMTEHCVGNKCGCPDTTEFGNGQCEGIYGGSCDPQCHEPFNLICGEFSNCTCAEKYHYESERNSRACLAGAGMPCSPTEECITNAFCRLGGSTGGTCVCDDAFTAAEDGLCVKKAGSSALSAAFFTILLSSIVAISNFKM